MGRAATASSSVVLAFGFLRLQLTLASIQNFDAKPRSSLRVAPRPHAPSQDKAEADTRACGGSAGQRQVVVQRRRRDTHVGFSIAGRPLPCVCVRVVARCRCTRRPRRSLYGGCNDDVYLPTCECGRPERPARGPVALFQPSPWMVGRCHLAASQKEQVGSLAASTTTTHQQLG